MLPPAPRENVVAWLWTDALADLLVERDRVVAARLSGWVERPTAYRLGEGQEPIDLARGLLEREADSGEGALGSRPV